MSWTGQNQERNDRYENDRFYATTTSKTKEIQGQTEDIPEDFLFYTA